MQMSAEELQLVFTILKVAVFPVVGFLAGFFVKWFLQSRKSRDELLRALAANRATAFQALWKHSILPDYIRRMKEDDIVPNEFLRKRNKELMDWYYAQANALFLSWKSTRSLFKAIDLLRSENPSEARVRKAFSSLRTALKRDCGMYSAWTAWRQLPTPRPEPWPANQAVQADAATQRR